MWYQKEKLQSPSGQGECMIQASIQRPEAAEKAKRKPKQDRLNVKTLEHFNP